MKPEKATQRQFEQIKKIFYKMNSLGLFEGGRYIINEIKNGIERGQFLIIKKDGVIIALLQYNNDRTNTLHIKKLWTAVPYRRKGLACVLINEAIYETQPDSIIVQCVDGAANNGFYERIKAQDHTTKNKGNARVREYILDAQKIRKEAETSCQAEDQGHK